MTATAESDGDAGEDDEEADALLLEEREAAGDEQVPEANPARLNQLVEMGFSEALAQGGQDDLSPISSPRQCRQCRQCR